MTPFRFKVDGLKLFNHGITNVQMCYGMQITQKVSHSNLISSKPTNKWNKEEVAVDVVVEQHGWLTRPVPLRWPNARASSRSLNTSEVGLVRKPLELLITYSLDKLPNICTYRFLPARSLCLPDDNWAGAGVRGCGVIRKSWKRRRVIRDIERAEHFFCDVFGKYFRLYKNQI